LNKRAFKLLQKSAEPKEAEESHPTKLADKSGSKAAQKEQRWLRERANVKECHEKTSKSKLNFKRVND
jgi:hypothetical protein